MPIGRINVEFKLLNWKFMNFSKRFRENTRVFTIKKILQERHGRMDDLKICFNSFADSNEVTDEMLTLAECGLKGQMVNTAVLDSKDSAAVEEMRSIPTVQLFYDFKPNKFSDPVILFFK